MFVRLGHGEIHRRIKGGLCKYAGVAFEFFHFLPPINLGETVFGRFNVTPGCGLRFLLEALLEVCKPPSA